MRVCGCVCLCVCVCVRLVPCQSIINQWIFRYFLFFHLTGELIIINKKANLLSTMRKIGHPDTCNAHQLAPLTDIQYIHIYEYIPSNLHFVILILYKTTFGSFAFIPIHDVGRSNTEFSGDMTPDIIMFVIWIFKTFGPYSHIYVMYGWNESTVSINCLANGGKLMEQECRRMEISSLCNHTKWYIDNM